MQEFKQRVRCALALKALHFYARHEHWMALADDPDAMRTNLVALGCEIQDGHGWEEAESALRAIQGLDSPDHPEACCKEFCKTDGQQHSVFCERNHDHD